MEETNEHGIHLTRFISNDKYSTPNGNQINAILKNIIVGESSYLPSL